MAHPTITAQQVTDRILQQVAVPELEHTVDTFKSGEPSATVTGIAVTMVPTLGVLQQAVASGCNLLIAHEPIFYNHLDSVEALVSEGDAVLAAKLDFIRQHDLITWRFHDYWHRREPDGVLQGMKRALGWAGLELPGQDRIFRLPETTLAALASDLKQRLNIRTPRVIGHPDMPVSVAALSPGFPGSARQRGLLQHPEVEVLVMGEDLEWEAIAYVADAVDAGMNKSAILLGHTPSEQAGMVECASWLRDFISEVPITYITTPEPFWPPG